MKSETRDEWIMDNDYQSDSTVPPEKVGSIDFPLAAFAVLMT